MHVPHPQPPVLDCRQLSIHAGSHAHTQLIAPFDWQVHTGERWAVLGRNGIGKTSLMHALLGLNPHANPRIHLNGHALHQLSPAAQAQQRIWTPQHYDEAFTISVLQAVHSIGQRPPIETRDTADTSTSDNDSANSSAHSWHHTVQQTLHQYGLWTHRHTWVHLLSGGERQRLTWVMAQLCKGTHTRLWLLDEPLAAQDIAWQRRLLHTLNQEPQLSLIATIHDLNQIRAFATHVLLLAEGSVLAQGPAHSVMRPEILSRAYQTDISIDEQGWIY